MKIGITGGEGFIGSKLMERIDNPEIFKGDLRNLEETRNFVNVCERIYHLAGKNRDDLGEIIKNNVISTSNIILSMKLENRDPEIILSSSNQVERNSNSEYGMTKAIEEDIIKHSEKWCIFRIPNVYGPGGRPFYNSVVATFCYQVSRGEPVKINDPSVQREFIFIEDLIDYLLNPEFNKLIYPKGEVMSIGEIHEFLTTRLGEHDKIKQCLDYYNNGGD